MKKALRNKQIESLQEEIEILSNGNRDIRAELNEVQQTFSTFKRKRIINLAAIFSIGVLVILIARICFEYTDKIAEWFDNVGAASIIWFSVGERVSIQLDGSSKALFRVIGSVDVEVIVAPRIPVNSSCTLTVELRSTKGEITTLGTGLTVITLDPGTYSLRVKDSQYCENTSSVTILSKVP